MRSFVYLLCLYKTTKSSLLQKIINIGTEKACIHYANRPLTCGYDQTEQHHAFLCLFVFGFIWILSFNKTKQKWKKKKLKCPKSQPGVVFRGTFLDMKYVCDKYIHVCVCVCVHVQETNIEPQTHDICMFRVRERVGAWARVRCVHSFINLCTCKFIGIYKYICTILHV